MTDWKRNRLNRSVWHLRRKVGNDTWEAVCTSYVNGSAAYYIEKNGQQIAALSGDFDTMTECKEAAEKNLNRRIKESGTEESTPTLGGGTSFKY